jgi:hypothetical protein
MADRRSADRDNLVFYLKVTNTQTGEPIGRVVDMSADGLMVVTGKPMPVGQEYDLCVAIPDGDHGERRWQVHAESLWCRNEANPELMDVGFKLKKLTGHDRRTIASLMATYGMHGPGSPA